jgi:predicted dehydrogenase
MAARCEKLPDLTAQGAPVFDTVEAFYAAGHRADLATIASPIQFHCVQACAALAAGSAVLCEKPVGALVEEADRMEAAERAAGRFLAIGYQWSYSRAIQALKADILGGRLGAPRRLKTSVLWPRGTHYFSRNNWAGRIKDGAGRWVLDSPVNNACAHYLHNMLYVLGDRVDTSARPVEVTAELYRAYPVETFDTCALRVRTDKGVEILFHTSHTTRHQINPEFVFEFERGTVRYSEEETGAQIVGTFADGSTCHYGDPAAEPRAKLLASLAALRGPASTIVCGVPAARMHTACVNALRDVPVHTFDPSRIDRYSRETGDSFLFVPGLEEMLGDAFEHDCLPSERHADLATAATTVRLDA